MKCIYYSTVKWTNNVKDTLKLAMTVITNYTFHFKLMSAYFGNSLHLLKQAVMYTFSDMENKENKQNK